MKELFPQEAEKPPPEPESPPAEVPDPPRQAEDTGSHDEPPEPEASPASDTPLKLADLASQLSLTPEKLFSAVNSEGHTAADAFVALKEQRDIDAERIELERGHNALRVERAQAEQDLSDYVALLPQGAVDEQLTQKLQAARQQISERTQARLLATIPEWKDPSQKQADVEDMVKMVSQFGAMPADLGNISEPWILNMTRHFTRLETRINSLLAKADKARPKGVKRGKGKPVTQSTGKRIDVADLVQKGLRQ